MYIQEIMRDSIGRDLDIYHIAEIFITFILLFCARYQELQSAEQIRAKI